MKERQLERIGDLNITHRCWRLVCKSEESGKGAAASLGCPLAIGSTGRTKDTKQYVARIPTWREAVIISN